MKYRLYYILFLLRAIIHSNRFTIARCALQTLKLNDECQSYGSMVSPKTVSDCYYFAVEECKPQPEKCRELFSSLR